LEFLRLSADEIGQTGVINDSDTGVIHRVFRTLLIFQKKHYLPLWFDLVKVFKKVSRQKNYRTLDLDDWSMRDPFWVVLLSVFRSALIHPEKWLASGDINGQTVGVLVHPTGASVEDCLDAISREKGCRMLIRRRGKFESEYLLNREYESALRNYSTKLPDLREKL
jgi:hypothetical protein